MYVLFGNALSLFSQKLHAALRFQGAPFEFRAIHFNGTAAAEVAQRAGTHQLPVLRTPENWMLGDTTPIIDMLDGRFPFRRLVPEGPLGLLVHLIDEYFDEWVSRVMAHYRWHYADSAVVAAPLLAGADPEMQRTFAGWGLRACRATGTETRAQQAAAEAEYRRLLVAMEAQLGETRYLLGDRPTLVDCAVLGGLLAHTWHDPDPRRVVAGFPRVVSWVEDGAWTWDGAGTLAPFPDSTAFARHVLADMPATWGRFIRANHAALCAGTKVFEIAVDGQTASFLARSYPEQSRRMIVDRIAGRLADADRAAGWDWLDRLGLADALRLPAHPAD